MSDHPAPPTLDDVARAAGVSTATVSRCLNDPKMVSAPTRERVDSAIKTLGYTPNFAARFMAVQRTFTVGAIIPTMENAIFARGLQAFQEELHHHGYTLLVSSSAYQAEAEEEQVRALVARGADGLLLIGYDRDQALYDYLQRQRVPVLAAWSFDPDAAIPSIGFDNRSAMRALTTQVLGMGHTRVAMISAHSAENDRARMRIEGARIAMEQNGLSADDLYVVEVSYDINEGAEAFKTLMTGPNRPSLVLCGNDVLAVGAMRGAAELGLSVPDDVSITGFDDIELAQVVTPALTTVHVPHRQMGRLAAQQLVDMIENKTDGVGKELESHVVMRGSVAEPRS
ncbi:LacI family DNA-binding transcriptional regulator [Thalassococcus lentus]|uniref:LacI family DNA-binding transcriptional regulator n=1 Tax=Thalassococcus lentus TaxID=1210524 RepID=A0ABT4XU89_9RHOB|nr:LacI family DNA-binding transcriptional regulator [Thalassococcus lentus]MDA7425520.1 LacI family DNA-binding transcriptional regulator [Thalassococcus lentus]